MGLERFRHEKETNKNEYVNIEVVESNIRQYNKLRGYRKYASMLDDDSFDITNRRVSIIDIEI